MDSFYPKFGEVEMVIVEDNNDFYDPLETNFECEDDNEDVKLQLNDTVYDDSQFDLDVNEPRSSSPIDECASSMEFVKQEIHELDECEKPLKNGRCIKSENLYDSDNESVGKSDLDFGCQDNDSDIEFGEVISDDVKPNLNEISNKKACTAEIQSEQKCNDSIRNERTPDITGAKTNDTKDVPHTQIDIDVKSAPNEIVTKTERKRKKRKQKTEEKVKVTASTSTSTSTSTSDSEKGVLPREARRKENKEEPETSTGKSTRHYSKRNEIPKQVVHMEAYDKKLLFCKICKIQFDKSPVFTEHMRINHNNDKPFECYICSKPYRICSLLAEHIRYHFGEKPYACKFCDRSFSQLQPYKAHVRKFHTLERPYKCHFIDENNVRCEESFFDTKTFKFHLRVHTNQQPFTCEFCSKKFNHSGTYQAHMRIHTNEKPYQCVICGKSFAQISTHKAHMLTHSDEFKFPCTLCDKKFKQATNLKLHMRVHTKETPYKCEDCGRGFAQLVTYRNHRRIHTGEKPFKCTYDECGKSFRHRNSFRRHLQTHTGEKPFECKICFKRLSQTSSYVSHMRRHEKLEKLEKIAYQH